MEHYRSSVRILGVIPEYIRGFCLGWIDFEFQIAQGQLAFPFGVFHVVNLNRRIVELNDRCGFHGGQIRIKFQRFQGP